MGDPSADPPAVAATQLALTIDDRPILRDINVRLRQGRTVALLGANGAGKSSLLRVLATLIPPTRGSLHLFGRSVGPNSVKIRARIGIIAHQPMLYRDLSPRENLRFFAALYDLRDPAQRIADMLDLVALTPRADDPVKTLSRGMVQRVAIARSLVHGPDLLLADEPFTGLDAPSTSALESLLAKLHAQGKTIVLVNHDIRQSLAISDDVVVLGRGRVALDQPAENVREDDVLAQMNAP